MNLKAETFIFDITYPENITNWTIIAELFDNIGNSLKLGSTASGGSDDQIQKIIIGETSSTFRIKIPSEATRNFDDIVNLEFKIFTGNTVGGKPETAGEIIKNINLVSSKIDWTNPNE